MRTDRLQRDYPHLRVIWRDFPLHPEVPEEGLLLSELFAGRNFDLAAAHARLRQIAGLEVLPLAERDRTSNSRRAQELGQWAESLGAGERWRKAVYHAFFVELKNIGEVDELLRLVGNVGLDAAEAEEVLVQGRCAAAVEADYRRARELAIGGVPAYFGRGRLMTGFHPYEDYLRLLGLG